MQLYCLWLMTNKQNIQIFGKKYTFMHAWNYLLLLYLIHVSKSGSFSYPTVCLHIKHKIFNSHTFVIIGLW